MASITGSGANPWWAIKEPSYKTVVQAVSKQAAGSKSGAGADYIHGPFTTRQEAENFLNGGSSGGGGNTGGGGKTGGGWWVAWSKEGSKWVGTVTYLTKDEGITNGSGPYATKAEAETVAKAGKGPGDAQGPTTHIGIPSIPNPVSGIDSLASTAEAVYNDVTDVNMWRSIGWIVLGIGLLGAGLYLWLKHEGVNLSIVSKIQNAVTGGAAAGGGSGEGGGEGGAGAAEGAAADIPIADV